MAGQLDTPNFTLKMELLSVREREYYSLSSGSSFASTLSLPSSPLADITPIRSSKRKWNEYANCEIRTSKRSKCEWDDLFHAVRSCKSDDIKEPICRELKFDDCTQEEDIKEPICRKLKFDDCTQEVPDTTVPKLAVLALCAVKVRTHELARKYIIKFTTGRLQ